MHEGLSVPKHLETDHCDTVTMVVDVDHERIPKTVVNDW